MGNCLKTQLKENVNNDNLDVFGYMSLSLIESTKTVRMKGTGIVKAPEGTYIKGSTTVTLSPSTQTTLSGANMSGTTSLIYIPKYSLTVFEDYGVSNSNVDIEMFKYQAGLTDLLAESHYIGNISALSNLTNLTSLDLVLSNCNGNVSELSNLTNLTVLNLTSNTKIYGDISSLSTLTSLTALRLVSTAIEGNADTMLNAFAASGRTNNLTLIADITKIHVTGATSAVMTIQFDGSSWSIA